MSTGRESKFYSGLLPFSKEKKKSKYFENVTMYAKFEYKYFVDILRA